RRPHAAAGGRSGKDQAVGAKQGEIARERRAVEGARLELAYHDVARLGCDGRHDSASVQARSAHAHALAGATVLPGPCARVPVVGAALAGRIDQWEILRPPSRHEALDRFHCLPRFLAAGVAPALDRFEDRLGLVPAEVVVDVNDEQRRALAEALAHSISGARKHLLIALGQKFVPDRFVHASLHLTSARRYSCLSLPTLFSGSMISGSRVAVDPEELKRIATLVSYSLCPGMAAESGHRGQSKMVMGKEIRLTFCVAKAGFPSGRKLGLMYFACINSKHAKSPSCGAADRRFGRRCRQCVQCSCECGFTLSATGTRSTEFLYPSPKCDDNVKFQRPLTGSGKRGWANKQRVKLGADQLLIRWSAVRIRHDLPVLKRPTLQGRPRAGRTIPA